MRPECAQVKLEGERVYTAPGGAPARDAEPEVEVVAPQQLVRQVVPQIGTQRQKFGSASPYFYRSFPGYLKWGSPMLK
jgi:hypothetical protein